MKGDVRYDLATVGPAVLKIDTTQNHRVSCRSPHLKKDKNDYIAKTFVLKSEGKCTKFGSRILLDELLSVKC